MTKTGTAVATLDVKDDVEGSDCVVSASAPPYSRHAKATFRKDRLLNIRLSSKHLEAIQKRALAEGLPYQTLISSLLHKYASGRLKEIERGFASIHRGLRLARQYCLIAQR
jgi:predicted DNA binding CopG/RHH family protein